MQGHDVEYREAGEESSGQPVGEVTEFLKQGIRSNLLGECILAHTALLLILTGQNCFTL